jgi:hypothetical protein
MTELGFEKRKYGVNYDFNISKIVNKVVFKNKLAETYEDIYRVYHKRSKTIEL